MEHSIIFATHIDVKPTNDFIWLAADLVAKGVTHVHVAIASHGGLTTSGICCYRIVEALGLQVTTYNVSNVDSAAVLLFLAGDERIMSPQSSILLHRTKRRFRADESFDEVQLAEALASLKQDTAAMSEIIASRTGLTPRKVRNLISSGTLLNADIALKLGFATKIGSFRVPEGSPVSTINA